MKKWLQLAARLYPSPWRRRYGAEFEALLDEGKLRWRDVPDVLLGAIKMQMAFWNPRNVTLACAFIGLVMATGASFAIPNEYVSRAVLRVRFPSTTTPAEQADRISALIGQMSSRSFLSQIIQRRDLNLYQKDREQKPLEDVIERMKDKGILVDIRAAGPRTSTLTVSFTYDDPIAAQRTMSVLITCLVDANQVAARNGHFRAVSTLDLLDPATLPVAPVFPNRGLISFIGLALGVGTGLLLAILRRRGGPTATPTAPAP
ncbi:MAG TPA: hypothetical protein VGL72_20945 [Bryobacteraceae bacterium]|jgi:uncharacterized protein involved in exopolysaccharide biosynthesis